MAKKTLTFIAENGRLWYACAIERKFSPIFHFCRKKNHRPHKQKKWVNKRLTNKLEFFMVMMARSESCCTSHFNIPQEIANHICDEIWILSFPISLSSCAHFCPALRSSDNGSRCVWIKNVWVHEKSSHLSYEFSWVHFLWARSLHPSTGENFSQPLDPSRWLLCSPYQRRHQATSLS